MSEVYIMSFFFFFEPEEKALDNDHVLKILCTPFKKKKVFLKLL